MRSLNSLFRKKSIIRTITPRCTSVTRHQVGSRNPDTRFDRTCSSVRVCGPKVTVVQKRKNGGSIRADPARRGPEATPVRASESLDRSAQHLRREIEAYWPEYGFRFDRRNP